MKHLRLAAAFLVCAATSADAGTVVVWDFSKQPGGEASVAATPYVSSATFSAITRGGGILADAGGHSINSEDWNVGTGYYDFIVTPKAGQTLHLGSLVYTDRPSKTYGPTNITVKFSTDGFAHATTIAAYKLVDSTGHPDYANHRETLNLSGFSALANLSKKVEFRIYATGTTDGRGTYRLGVNGTPSGPNPANLILNSAGTSATAVPEPGSVLLLGLGVAGAITFGRRWGRAA